MPVSSIYVRKKIQGSKLIIHVALELGVGKDSTSFSWSGFSLFHNVKISVRRTGAE